MRSMGLDIGDRRTGIAISDPLGILANPLMVIKHTGEEDAIDTILGIVREYQIENIIVGMPYLMNGTSGIQVEKVSVFVDKLKQLAPVNIEIRDERLTTATAKQILESKRSKKSSRYQKGKYDAVAAAIILQSYLNESRPLKYPEP